MQQVEQWRVALCADGGQLFCGENGGQKQMPWSHGSDVRCRWGGVSDGGARASITARIGSHGGMLGPGWVEETRRDAHASRSLAAHAGIVTEVFVLRETLDEGAMDNDST